jgi:hypothetical protein
MMVLLDVYRGTFEASRHLATWPKDLEELQRRRLIEIRAGTPEITPYGTKRVLRSLDLVVTP